MAEVERESRENGSGWSLGVMECHADCTAGRHPFRDFYSEGSRGYLQVWAEKKQYPPYLVDEPLWLPYGELTVPRGEAGKPVGTLVVALRWLSGGSGGVVVREMGRSGLVLIVL